MNGEVRGRIESFTATLDGNKVCNWCKKTLYPTTKDKTVQKYTLVGMRISREFHKGKCFELGTDRMIMWAMEKETGKVYDPKSKRLLPKGCSWDNNAQKIIKNDI